MRIDLHVHSCFSKDSNADIDSILEFAKKNGLDGVAICDHDTREGGLACARRARELGSDIIVIPGIEVTSSKGHILVLDPDGDIESGMTPEKTIERARELGGVVIIPHPFKITSHGIGYVEGLDADAVEVLNSRCVTGGANNKAKRVTKELGFPQVGGSDSHEAKMVGCSYTEVDASDRNVESVLHAIREGNVTFGGRRTPASYVVKQMMVGKIKKAKLALGIRTG
ncbi:PHP domain-containing protein [Methanococcoides orientis]|uniref:CehA/McbA family metallohydrolase n=1 Tax=Methanococcoides orientis TaxID=2822137 RepID=UPI001E5FFD5E|nr:PHP domain-containing protein [Methanococcoides orientis]UGV40908.1 PHP domain-containing protein [Methanococcoides orientis]